MQTQHFQARFRDNLQVKVLWKTTSNPLDCPSIYCVIIHAVDDEEWRIRTKTNRIAGDRRLMILALKTDKVDVCQARVTHRHEDFPYL